jgi:hypothetical protein
LAVHHAGHHIYQMAEFVWTRMGYLRSATLTPLGRAATTNGMARKKDTDHTDRTDLMRLRRELVALEQRQFELEAERRRLAGRLSLMSVEESAILLAQRGYNTSPPPLRALSSPTNPTYPTPAKAEAG